MSKYEKGSIGYFLDLAKKDGFDNIKDWNEWRKRTGKLPDATVINSDNHKKTVENAGLKNLKEYKDLCSQKKGYKDRNERESERRWNKGINSPMSENEDSSEYFGIYIVEKIWAKKILELKFGEIEQEMSYGNQGFDFIVKGGTKIDCKATVLYHNVWCFEIDYNNIADYFLLWGFDSRENMNPIHVWLIHKYEMIRERKFWRRNKLCITNDANYLLPFDKYELKEELEKILVGMMS